MSGMQLGTGFIIIIVTCSGYMCCSTIANVWLYLNIRSNRLIGKHVWSILVFSLFLLRVTIYDRRKRYILT